MMERKMRRLNQQLAPEEVTRILREGKYAVWAVEGDEDYPYGVPVNYVFNGDSAIYIHSARQGHKIDAIGRNERCSLCIVDKDDVVAEEFTSYFRSVIAFGRARIVNSPAEVIDSLKLLCEKYSPGIDPTAEINRFQKTVCIIRIDLDRVSGKESIELVRARREAISKCGQ